MTRLACLLLVLAAACQRREIDLLPRLLVALDLEEREGTQRLGPLTRAKRAEGFADLAVLMAAAEPDQGVGRMGAERGRESDLLFGRRARLRHAGRAEMRDQPLCQKLDRGDATVVR